MNWHKLTTAQANEIIEANRNDITVASLEEYAAELTEQDTKPDFGNVVGQDSLTRFDQPKRRRNKRKSKKQVWRKPQAEYGKTHRPRQMAMAQKHAGAQKSPKGGGSNKPGNTP